MLVSDYEAKKSALEKCNPDDPRVKARYEGDPRGYLEYRRAWKMSMHNLENPEEAQRERYNRAQQLRKEAQEIRKAKYKEYLRSDDWKWKRSVCLEYYRHCCAICNSKDQIDVHHRTYERVFFELPSDLIALCHKCHELFHGKLDTIDSDYFKVAF